MSRTQKRVKKMTDSTENNGVQSTGHNWDGIEELENRVPMWWTWAFYFSVVIVLGYWVLYPAWPLGDTYTKGVMTITYTNHRTDGTTEELTTNWNTRALLAYENEHSSDAKLRNEYLAKVSKASISEILNDQDMLAFTNSAAKGLFGDNCAACHGTGGVGLVGLFPNLADDDWLWGGKSAEIQNSINDGRIGYMPDFADSFTEKELDDVASYVLSLSTDGVNAEKAASGQAIFNGEAGGCHYCHTSDATGLKSQGAANLTDSIWTVADVDGADTLEAKKARIADVISNGVQRTMPAWEDRRAHV